MKRISEKSSGTDCTGITGALYEGVRHSQQPSLYNFRSTYFPDEGDA